MEDDVSFKLEDNGTGIVKASGELNIYRAASLKAALSEAMDSSERVELDLHGVESLDVSCIQVILSALKSSAVAGRALAFKWGMPEALLKTAREAGYGDLGGAGLDIRG